MRILDKRLILITYVSGEDYLALIAVFSKPYFYGCRTEKVSDIRESDGDVLIYIYVLLLRAGNQAFDGSVRVLHLIQRLGYLHGSASLGLSALPVSFLHLYVRTVS